MYLGITQPYVQDLVVLLLKIIVTVCQDMFALMCTLDAHEYIYYPCQASISSAEERPVTKYSTSDETLSPEIKNIFIDSNFKL